MHYHLILAKSPRSDALYLSLQNVLPSFLNWWSSLHLFIFIRLNITGFSKLNVGFQKILHTRMCVLSIIIIHKFFIKDLNYYDDTIKCIIKWFLYKIENSYIILVQNRNCLSVNLIVSISSLLLSQAKTLDKQIDLIPRLGHVSACV